ncbi:MAG: hypothetical protein V1898_01235 [Patescibacteria group bacterium]
MNITERSIPELPKMLENLMDIISDKEQLEKCPKVEYIDSEGYLLFSTPEVYNGEQVRFEILYKPSYTIEGVCWQQIYFIYSNEDGPAAEVDFVRSGEVKYSSQHRYVEMDKPSRRGMPTALLKRAEQFFQLLANRKGEDIELRMGAAQVHVLEWAIKNGYALRPEDEEQVAQILKDFHEGNPDSDFIFQDEGEEINGKSFVRRHYIHKKKSSVKNSFSAMRLSTFKTIPPKRNTTSID